MAKLWGGEWNVAKPAEADVPDHQVHAAVDRVRCES